MYHCKLSQNSEAQDNTHFTISHVFLGQKFGQFGWTILLPNWQQPKSLGGIHLWMGWSGRFETASFTCLTPRCRQLGSVMSVDWSTWCELSSIAVSGYLVGFYRGSGLPEWVPIDNLFTDSKHPYSPPIFKGKAKHFISWWEECQRICTHIYHTKWWYKK